MFAFLCYRHSHVSQTYSRCSADVVRFEPELFLFCVLKWGSGALLVGHQTCDSQVVGSTPGRAPLHSDCGQATYNCVPLSPGSTIWYWPKGGYALHPGR